MKIILSYFVRSQKLYVRKKILQDFIIPISRFLKSYLSLKLKVITFQYKNYKSVMYFR